MENGSAGSAISRILRSAIVISSPYTSRHRIETNRENDNKDKDKGKVKKINPNDEVANAINRLPIWAHEILEDTDDPFVEDFGDDITAPLKEIEKLKSVLKSFPYNMLFVFKYTNLLS